MYKRQDKLWAVDELKGFAIAGADGHFQWAEAVVVNGNQVAVWHKDIPHPVTVRYGWDDNPVHANLKNRTGLPASPFQISLEDKKFNRDPKVAKLSNNLRWILKECLFLSDFLWQKYLFLL